MIRQTLPVMIYITCLMVVHSCNVYHGQEVKPLRVYVMYVTYVTNRYGKGTIVFDGYADGPAIKDATHCRRTGSSKGPNVIFTGETSLKLKKNEFLGNKINKQWFLHLLSSFLENAGCTIIHAKGDADILNVKTAVDSAKAVNTVLIGDDTDLLILLCYYGDAIEKES